MAQIDDGILRALGAVALHFSELEESLFRHTAKLVDRNDLGIGEAILAGMDLRLVTEIFEALVRERTGWRYTFVRNPRLKKAQEIQERLKPLVSKIDKAREKRNEIFHAYWSPHYILDPASESFVRSKGSVERTKRKKKHNKGSMSNTTRWTVEQIQAVGAEIEEAALELDKFVTWANTLTPLFPEEGE